MCICFFIWSELLYADDIATIYTTTLVLALVELSVNWIRFCVTSFESVYAGIGG